jgi:pyruvate ferredoxin oxidoreductase gamma subunit
MIEIRIHGRGGQGVKKSSMLIARAAFLKGYKTQDFALYGAERRGAPVTSFVRLDKNKINTRGYVFEPDYIIILDESIEHEQVLKGLTNKTKILINTKNHPKGECSVDATGIAMGVIGKPIPNVALLGGFAKVSNLFDLNDLKNAVDKEFVGKNKEMLKKNIEAAKKCYEEVKCL